MKLNKQYEILFDGPLKKAQLVDVTGEGPGEGFNDTADLRMAFVSTVGRLPIEVDALLSRLERGLLRPGDVLDKSHRQHPSDFDSELH